MKPFFNYLFLLLFASSVVHASAADFSIKSLTPSDDRPCLYSSWTLTAELEYSKADVQLQYRWHFKDLNSSTSEFQLLSDADTNTLGASTAVLLKKTIKYSDIGKYMLIVSDVTTGQSDTAVYQMILSSYNESIQLIGEKYFSVCQGSDVSLNFEFEKDGTYTYYLLNDGIARTLKTVNKTGSIVFKNVQKSFSGQFTIINRCGNSEDFNTAVKVFYPPVFIEQPIRKIQVPEGGDFMLTVEAKSEWPVEYTWYKDGHPFGSQIARFQVQGATSEFAGMYYVRAANDCGEAFSDTSYVTIVPTTVEAEHKLSKILAFPNPAESTVVIPLNEVFSGKIYTVELYNSAGKKTVGYTTTFIEGGNTLKLSGLEVLPVGLYFISISDGYTVVHRTLSIVHKY